MKVLMTFAAAVVILAFLVTFLACISNALLLLLFDKELSDVIEELWERRAKGEKDQ